MRIAARNIEKGRWDENCTPLDAPYVHATSLGTKNGALSAYYDYICSLVEIVYCIRTGFDSWR